MTSKRERLSRVAARLGLIRLLEYFARRPSLIAISYHRVAVPEACPYDRDVIDATPDAFDEQIGYLKRRYHLVDLEEAQAIAEQRTPLRRCHVLVTFDDGYRDVFTTALPILRSHGLRAAFFLTTGFVGSNRVPWWDRLAFVVRSSRVRRFTLEYPRPVVLDAGEIGVESVIRRILSLYKHRATVDTARFLSQVEEMCGVELPKEAPEPLFLSWTEARELVRAGMSIGSHTHTHELLAKLPEEQQVVECQRSRDLLREKLSAPVEALAFPVGSRESFSDTTRRCLRAAGYTIAFSNYGGVNTDGMDPLNLLRMPVDHMSVDQYRLRTAFAGAINRQVW